MSNIRTIITNKAKVFGKLSEAELKNQLKALNYIELLAMQTKISLSDWDVLNTFRAKHGSNKLITNPKEINKRLFTLAEKAKIGMQKSHVQDVIKHEKKILKLAKEMFGYRVASIQGNIADQKRRIENDKAAIKRDEENATMTPGDKAYRLKNYTNSIAGCEQQIVRLEESLVRTKEYATTDRLVKDVAKIVMGGFWKFFGISGNNLLFLTANNIILFEKNHRAGLNLQKDMGVYKVKLNLEHMQNSVHIFYGNTKSGDNIHPYVSQGGICFGNSGSYYNKARQENDIVQMMNMLSIVLSTYSSAGGPYRRLADFRLDPNIPATKEAERYLAKKTPPEDKRLAELMQSVSVKDVANKLAKSIGPKKIEEVDESDDDEEEYEDEDGYDDEE